MQHPTYTWDPIKVGGGAARNHAGWVPLVSVGWESNYSIRRVTGYGSHGLPPGLASPCSEVIQLATVIMKG